MPIHVDYTLEITDLPGECIGACSAPGDVSEAVAYWRDRLGFTVNPDRARRYLDGFGAWDDLNDPEAWPPERLAEYVLWIACGDFADWLTGDLGCGSDIVVLEG